MSFHVEESIGYLANIAARLMSQSLHIRLAKHGASIGEWPFLACLWQRDGQTVRELSEFARTAEPTAVRTIDRMERDGLVRRVANTMDRRSVHVHLTERGRALRKELVPCAKEIIDIAMDGLTGRKIAEFTAVLEHMIARFDAEAVKKENADG
ncbi:MAG: MarR family transcriptional regulator [Phycisphaerales bacterium]|nr:MarR family transcriptional regulator [Phycisphaerales bacterium]